VYQVLARKWRPANFEQLVGQRHVARTLTNAIKADRLAHAYIFAGLRGTGKTTVARILAKCVDCEKGPSTTPCDACAPCTEISESRSVDVLEIDAASRTKVDQTRELLEMVSYAPARDRYKIIIIDEAHMLSKASFNALLKTLEEPPPRVMFILATTELQKILPTIISRCQVFEFRRVGVPEMVEHLRKICTAEKIEISDSSIDRIARAGEGSVRDSLSVLERVFAFCGQQVADEDVVRVLGAVQAVVLSKLIEGLAARDAGAMLAVLDQVVDEGHDLIHLWNETVAALRDLLFLETVPDRSDLLSRAPEEAAALERAGAGLSREDLSRAFQILAELEFPLKSSSQPRFMFEAALIRLASLGSVRPIEDLLRELGSAPATGPAPRTSARPATPARRQKKTAPEAKPAPRAVAVHGSGTDGFVAAVHDAKPMLGALLDQAAGVELAGGEVVVRFESGAELLAKPLQRKESLALLQQLARTACDGAGLRIEVGGAPTAPGAGDERASKASAPAPGRPAAPRASGGGSSKRSLLEDAKQEPGVKKLLREFGAQVVEVRPLEMPKAPVDAHPEGPREESS